MLASLPSSLSKANLLSLPLSLSPPPPRHFPFPALPFGEICVYNNAMFTKVSVWWEGSVCGGAVTTDRGRLEGPMTLPHSLKKSLSSHSLARRQKHEDLSLSPLTSLPPPPPTLCSLVGPGKIKGTDDSARCPFVSPLEGTHRSVNRQAQSHVS